MSEELLADCTVEQLLRLMTAATGRSDPCSASDLAAIFRDQRSTPISCVLVEAATGQSESIDTTLDAVLFDPNPSAPLLAAMKTALKGRDETEVPLEVTTALCYVTIALGITRCSEKLTTLSDEDVALRLCWLSRKAWVDSDCREVAQRALAELRRRPASG